MGSIALLTVLLAASASAADPKAALQAQVVSKDAQIAVLRVELDQARASVDSRIEVARSGLEAANRALEARMDQARADAAAERLRTNDAKEQLARAQGLLVAAQDQIAASAGDKPAIAAALAKLSAAQSANARAASVQRAAQTTATDTNAEAAQGAVVAAAEALRAAERKRTDNDDLARMQAEATLRSSESARLASNSGIVISLIGFLTVFAGLWFKDRSDKRQYSRDIDALARSNDAVAKHVLSVTTDLGALFPSIADKPRPEISMVAPLVRGAGGGGSP